MAGRAIDQRWRVAGLPGLLVWLLLVFCAPLQALDSERAIYQFPHTWYSSQLPQSTVLSIVQRADGSMWMATYGGLAHYSGATFETFDQRNAPVLRSTAMTTLLEDREHTLWIGTLNGGLYRLRGEAIESVDLPATVDSVFGIAQSTDGTLYLTTNVGVARGDASGFTLFARSAFGTGPFRSIVADAANGIWVAVDGTGVAHCAGDNVTMYTAAEGLPSTSVYSLRLDASGVVWAGTKSGLVRFAAGRFESEPRAALLDGHRIYGELADRDGNLWISAQDAGLCRMSPLRMECDSTIAGLNDEIVRSMALDREGNLWIGTTNGGVHRLSESKLITFNGAIKSNSIRAVFEDADAHLWLATDGGGLATISERNIVPDIRNAQLPSLFLRSLAADTQHNLWVGSIEGASRLGADGSVHNFGTRDGLPALIVFAIAPRAAGGVWAGTTHGVAQIVGDEVKAVAGTQGDDVRALFEAGDGTLWIGQRSGLHCLRQSGLLDTCGTEGLAETSVFAFHPDGRDDLWIGTSKGLMRMRDGQLTRYGERAGLVGDAIFSILDDAVGNFWLSSNRGIARVAMSELAALDAGRVQSIEPEWCGKSDGMLSSQGNGASQSPAWRTRDGRLWIGTTDGVVLVDPAHAHRNTLKPLVAIERLSVDGKKVDTHKEVMVAPGADRLEFDYAAMSYVAPEMVRYRYRLEGYDHDRVDAAERRAAYYTNIPAGKYDFHVVASNNDGVWNDEGAALAFVIQPRLRDTKWFRALAGLGVLVALIGLYQFRLWRVRASERALIREVALRTEELRAANGELRRLASLDGLTRIGNRGAFEDALARQWNNHQARAASLAVLLCDIDVFKAYNDSYGHVAGDAALIHVAASLRSALRQSTDLAARYGGEEFVLLLSDCDTHEAAQVAKNLLDAVHGLTIEHRASSVSGHVTISIGFAAEVPRPGHAPDSLVRAADAALYRAKAAGRDRSCGADSEA